MGFVRTRVRRPDCNSESGDRQSVASLSSPAFVQRGAELFLTHRAHSYIGAQTKTLPHDCNYVQYPVSASNLHPADAASPAPVACRRAHHPVPDLAPFYYLKNFELVLATVASRYRDLLLDEELRFISEFSQLPLRSRALLTRMVMRSGDMFRASKLNYVEIGDTQVAAGPLIEAGWVCLDPPLSILKLHQLLTKSELVRCLKLPSSYGRWRKTDLKLMLEKQFPQALCFKDWYGARDSVYALLVEPLCERFRLMFFGNCRQSWSEFVTSDLGIFRYEKVERSVQSRPFETREHIEVFERIQSCHELLADGMPPEQLAPLMPAAVAGSAWLEERRQALLFLRARACERDGQLSTALDQYLQCNHREARSRAIRLKVKLGDWEGARVLCAAGQQYPESEAEAQQLRRAMARVHRKLKIPVEAKQPVVIPAFKVVLEGVPRGKAVEYHVRDYLARDLADRTTVRYVENGLIPSLFGLLCWPAIFAPVPGAFFHDFQRGPIDLDSSHFCRRRQEHFDRCLSYLASGEYKKAIWNCFRQKWGLQSPFVRWHRLDRTMLQWALDCFPSAHLQAWFDWILRDLKENRVGFPDLVQFYPKERTYRLIEIKGPGDRLQDNQRRLLEHGVLHQMPVSVCWVQWPAVDGRSDTPPKAQPVSEAKHAPR